MSDKLPLVSANKVVKHDIKISHEEFVKNL
jgi:hypothetical protein